MITAHRRSSWITFPARKIRPVFDERRGPPEPDSERPRALLQENLFVAKHGRHHSVDSDALLVEPFDAKGEQLLGGDLRCVGGRWPGRDHFHFFPVVDAEQKLHELPAAHC